MPQLSQGLGFDLADTFTGNGERLAHLLQRQFVAVFQPEAHLDNSLLARCKRLQHGSQMFLQVEVDGRIRWRNDALVLDKVAQVGLFVFSDGCLERHGLLRDLLCFANRVNGKIHAPCEFLGSWLASEFLDKLPAGAGLLVDRFDHVHGHADGARLIGDGASDALANPPSCVGGEFVTAPPFEFVCALHESDVALLDQIEELHAAIGIFLGNRNDEAKVCLGELGFGLLGFRLAKPNGRERALSASPNQLRTIPRCSFVPSGAHAAHRVLRLRFQNGRSLRGVRAGQSRVQAYGGARL